MLVCVPEPVYGVEAKSDKDSDEDDEGLDLDRALLDLGLDEVVLDLLVGDRPDRPDDHPDGEVDVRPLGLGPPQMIGRNLHVS